MICKKRFQNRVLNIFLIFMVLFNGVISAGGQANTVASDRIGGGSSVFVYRTVSKSKSGYAPKRRSNAKRTQKQRTVTRRNIIRQSTVVAKKNRTRRNIKVVTPTEFKVVEAELERKSKEETSQIFAGAGEYYIEQDDVEKAVEYMEQAVEFDPNNTDAKLALSEIYTTLADKTADLAEEYKIKVSQAEAEKNSTDARKFFTQESFARKAVESYLTKAIELDPQNSSAHAGYGIYLDEQGKENKARVKYEKALEIDPALTEIKAPLAIIYIQNGEIEKADRYITEAFDSGNRNAEVHFYRGLIQYEKQKQDSAAKESLEQSLALDNENAEAHYYLGAMLIRLADKAEKDGDTQVVKTNTARAISEYIKATDLDATFVLAWFDLGVAYYNNGMYEEALESYQKAIKFNRNQTDEEKQVYQESFLNTAETFRQLEQFDEAITKYRVAADLLKDDVDLLTNYGYVLIRQKRWIDAVKSFERATQIQPDSISFANLGWAFYQESQDHLGWNRSSQQKACLLKSQNALQTAIKKDAAFETAYLNLGNVLIDLGEYNEAIKALDKSLELHKNWELAEYTIGTAYLESGDLDKAYRQFSDVIKANKENSDAYFGLGKTEIKRGRTKEAEKIVKDLRTLNPAQADELERLLSKKTISIK